MGVSRHLIQLSSLSIILDGEMLVWDPVSERNLPFGTLKTAALGESLGHVLLQPLIRHNRQVQGRSQSSTLLCVQYL